MMAIVDGCWRARCLAAVCVGALPVLVACGGEAAREPSRAGRSEPATVRERMAGCYDLLDRNGKLAARSLWGAASRIRLEMTDERRPRERNGIVWRWQLSRLAIGREPGGPAEAGWAADPRSDSVRVMLSDGFSGTELVLPSHGDTLVGRATGHWDFTSDSDEGRVTAVRIACAPDSLHP